MKKVDREVLKRPCVEEGSSTKKKITILSKEKEEERTEKVVNLVHNNDSSSLYSLTKIVQFDDDLDGDFWTDDSFWAEDMKEFEIEAEHKKSDLP